MVVSYPARRLFYCIYDYVSITWRPCNDGVGEGATPEQYEAMRVQMGLDRSFIEQFFHYIKMLLSNLILGDRMFLAGWSWMKSSPFAQHNQIISMECVICLADWYSTGSDLCFETLFQG